LIVADGEQVHHQHSAPGGVRASSNIQHGNPLPCEFRPDAPWIGDMVFLFARIAEGVARSEYLREEGGASVAEVEYETPPLPGLMARSSPITFWIDKTTNLILRLEHAITHRRPASGETHSSRHTHHYSYVAIDQPIPAESFVYQRPAAVLEPPRSHISTRGGGGSAGGIGAQRYETWRSNSWEDGIFVDTFKLRARNMDLLFERRFTFEEGALKVTEKITGPRGVTEREYSI
jgi:hypothetical protein